MRGQRPSPRERRQGSVVFYTSRRRNQPSGSSQRAEGGGAPQPQTTRAGGARQGDTGSHRAPPQSAWMAGAGEACSAEGWSMASQRRTARRQSLKRGLQWGGHNGRAEQSDAPPLRTALEPGGVRWGRALQAATGQHRTALSAHPGRGSLCVGHMLSSRTGARPPQSPWRA